MAVVGGRRIELKQSASCSGSVPNDPISKLMYYLATVDYLLNAGIPRRLKDYPHYFLLNHEEIKSVVTLSLLFSLEELIKHNIIIIAPELCPTHQNTYYELSDKRVNVVVDRNIVLGERHIQVHKFMAIKNEWGINFYINPLRELLVVQPAQKPITYSNQNYNNNNTADFGGCCLLI